MKDENPLYKVIFDGDGSAFLKLDEAIPAIRNNVVVITRGLTALDPDYAEEENGAGWGKMHVQMGHYISARGIMPFTAGTRRIISYKHACECYGTQPLPLDSESLRHWIRALYRYRGQMRGDFWKILINGV